MSYIHDPVHDPVVEFVDREAFLEELKVWKVPVNGTLSPGTDGMFVRVCLEDSLCDPDGSHSLSSNATRRHLYLVATCLIPSHAVGLNLPFESGHYLQLREYLGDLGWRIDGVPAPYPREEQMRKKEEFEQAIRELGLEVRGGRFVPLNDGV